MCRKAGRDALMKEKQAAGSTAARRPIGSRTTMGEGGGGGGGGGGTAAWTGSIGIPWVEVDKHEDPTPATEGVLIRQLVCGSHVVCCCKVLINKLVCPDRTLLVAGCSSATPVSVVRTPCGKVFTSERVPRHFWWRGVHQSA